MPFSASPKLPVGLVCGVTLLMHSLFLTQAAAQPGGEYETIIRRGLNAIYFGNDQDAEKAFAELEKLREGHPASAVYRALLYSWRSAGDPGNSELVAKFRQQADIAISISLAWTTQWPSDPDGWRYLASVFGQLSQFAVTVQDSPWGALVAGKKMHSAVEKARELDPKNPDIYLGIGAWDYFTGKVSLFIRPIAWLFGLGWGNPERGRIEIQRAMNGRGHMQTEAAMVFASTYWSEGKYTESGQALRDNITSKYPKLLPAHTLLVSGCICAGDFLGADVAVSRADEDQSWRMFQLGRIALAKGDAANAALAASEFSQAVAAKGPTLSITTWARIGRGRAMEQLHQKNLDDWQHSSDIEKGAVALADRLFRKPGKCPH